MAHIALKSVGATRFHLSSRVTGPFTRNRGTIHTVLRRLFTLASVASLLLCAATIVLWVRSYWTGDTLEWNVLVQRDAPEEDMFRADHYRTIRLLSGRGGFLVQGEEQYPNAGADWPLFDVATRPHQDVRHAGSTLGFDYETMPYATYVSFPAWAAVLATLIVPGFWSARVFVARRRAKLLGARCVCGCDLTGNVSGTCPECGTPVPQKATA